MVRSSEDAEQIVVVEYCDLIGVPIVHIANEGKRSVAYGAKLKRMGLRKGFPDLFIPIPQGQKHGLFIEMKHGGNKCTPEQKKWLERLNFNGYLALRCNGADEAIKVINDYIGRKN